jgi:hypothetical protein
MTIFVTKYFVVMIKLHSLNPHKLRLGSLAGLSFETIDLGNAAGDALGPLGAVALDKLAATYAAFSTNFMVKRGSRLTAQIREGDELRDNYFAEVRRTAKTASKSSIAANAAAGRVLVAFLKPFRDVRHLPLPSETTILREIKKRYEASDALKAAAATLQLSDVFTTLFAANASVSALYDERAEEIGRRAGPSATSLRRALETAYHNFCSVVVQTLRLQPSAALQALFWEMNTARIKCVKAQFPRRRRVVANPAEAAQAK